MPENNVTDASHQLPAFAWQPGTLKNARKKRMQLAWSVWLVAAIFVLYQFFLQLSSGEMIAGLMHSFALTALSGGVLAGSYYYIYVLLQTPAGMLLDRYGPRCILSVGALIVCAGGFIFSLSHSFVMALLGRILMGGGSAFAFVGCLNVIAIWFPKRQFALMTAIVETAGMMGAIIGNFGLAHGIEKIGWRDCMMFAAVFAGILSLFLFAIVRNAPRKKTICTQTTVQSSRTAFHHMLKNPVIWMNGVYSGLMFSVVTVFVALWAIPFFQTIHHLSLMQATVVASALYAGVAVGGPLLGWLDSRTQWRKWLLIFNAIAAALCLFFVIFDAQLSSLLMGLLLFLAGICASSYVLTFAIVNEIAMPQHRAMGMGFTNMLCVAFAPILQPLVGFLITAFDGVYYFQWAMSVIPALLFVAAGLAFFLPQRQALKLRAH